LKTLSEIVDAINGVHGGFTAAHRERLGTLNAILSNSSLCLDVLDLLTDILSLELIDNTKTKFRVSVWNEDEGPLRDHYIDAKEYNGLLVVMVQRAVEEFLKKQKNDAKSAEKPSTKKERD